MAVSTKHARTVRALKRHLEGHFLLTRFRQRLLHEGNTLDDHDTVVDLPAGLQLVLLPFADASEEQEQELISAADLGQVSFLEEILQRPQNPNKLVRGHGGALRTALGVAADRGHTEIVRLLLEASADNSIESYNFCSGYEATPFVQACCRGHVQVARLLLESRAFVEEIGCWCGQEVTPLHAAILGPGGDEYESGSYLETVQLLLEAVADPNSSIATRGCLPHDARPLVAACQGGHLEVARLLLTDSLASDGAAVPMLRLEANAHLAPAFVAAAEMGHREVTSILFETMFNGLPATAMPQSRASCSINTPLFLASQDGRAGIARLLLEARADKHTVCGPDGLTALSAAAGNGHAEIVRLLLRSGRAHTSPTSSDPFACGHATS